MDLGTLRVGLLIDASEYERQLNEYKAKTLKFGEDLEKSFQRSNLTLSPKVDHKPLTSLNKHLDLKQRHFKEVQRYFNSNPLRPNVNTKELEKLQIALREIKSNPNLNVTVKGKVSNSTSNSSSKLNVNLNPLKSDLKDIEKAVKDGSKTSLFNAIKLGVGQQIGSSLSKGTAKLFRDTLGVDLGKSAYKAAEKPLNFGKSLIADNTELKKAIDDFGNKLEARLKKIRYAVGDAVVAALEVKPEAVKLENGIEIQRPATVQDRLNAFVKSGVNVEEIKRDLKEVVTEAKKAGNDIRKALIFNSVIKQEIDKQADGLREFREEALKERAIPLVQERAVEILQQKRAKNSAKVVNDQTEELVIAVGGYAGARGLSGARLAQDLNKEKKPGREAIWVKNEDTDIPKEAMGRASDKLLALLASLSKPNLRGYSKDAVEIAAQALAAKELNPEVKIKILGESGGGFPAEEAAKILEMLGIKGVEYLGVGTPNLKADLNAPGQKIISPDEQLGAETAGLYAKVGFADVSKPGQNILGVQGHPFENYKEAGIAELMNFLEGSPTPFSENELKQVKDISKQMSKTDLSKMDSRQVESIAKAAFGNLQQVRRRLLAATGDLKNELEEIADTFQEVYVKTSPDNRDFDTIRTVLKQAEEQFTELDANRGVGAGQFAAKALPELQNFQKEFEEKYQDTVGTIQEKFKILNEELLTVINKYSDLSLSAKTPPDRIGNDRDLLGIAQNVVSNKSLEDIDRARFLSYQEGKPKALSSDAIAEMKDRTLNVASEIKKTRKGSVKKELLRQVYDANLRVKQQYVEGDEALRAQLDELLDVYDSILSENSTFVDKFEKDDKKTALAQLILKLQERSNYFQELSEQFPESVGNKYKEFAKQLDDAIEGLANLTVDKKSAAIVTLAEADSKKLSNVIKNTVSKVASTIVQKAGESVESALVNNINSQLAVIPGQEDTIDLNPRQINNLSELRPKDLVHLARTGTGGLAKAAGQVMSLAQGAEDLTLDMIPFGKPAKKVLQKTVLPAAAFTAGTHLLPGGQAVAQGATHLLEGAMNVPAGALAETLTIGAAEVVTNTVGNIPMVGGKLAAAANEAIEIIVSAVSQTVVEGAATVATPVIGGQAMLGAANAIIPEDLKPQTDQKTIEATKKKVAQLQASVKNMQKMSAAGNTQALIGYREVINNALPPVKEEIDNIIKSLPPADRTGTPEGAQLANLKKQVLEIDKKTNKLAQFVNGVAKMVGNPKQTMEASVKGTDVIDVQVVSSEKVSQETQKALLESKKKTQNAIQDDLKTTAKLIKSLGNKFSAQVKALPALTEEGQYSAANEIIESVADARKAIDELLATFGKNAPKELKEAARIARGQITNAEKKATNVTVNTSDEIKGVAKNTQMGFSKSIDSSIGDLRKQGESFAQAFIEGAEDKFEIRSPSRVFQRIGQFVVQGFNKGLELVEVSTNKFGEVIENVKSMASNGVNTSSQNNSSQPTAVKNKTEVQGTTELQSTGSTVAKTANNVANNIKGGFEGLQNLTFDDLKNNLLGLKDSIFAVGKGFLAFQALAFILPLLNSISETTTPVAREFEKLENVIIFSSGGAKKGAENIAFIRSEVKRLNVDLKTSLQSFANLAATSRDTSLEGSATKQTFSAVSQASAVLGLTPDEQTRAFTALEQIISKNILSMEELRGQLSEAIPGAMQIAARSFGVTTAELNKMVASGDITAEQFIPRFAQQLSAETRAGAETAASSSQGRLNQFNNAVTDATVTIGKNLLPLQNFTFNALAVSIEAVMKILPSLVSLLSTVAVMLTVNTVAGLTKVSAGFVAARFGITSFGKALTALRPILASMLRQFIIIYGAIEIFNRVQNAFKDMGGEARKYADAAKKAEIATNAMFEASNKESSFKAPQTVDELRGSNSLEGLPIVDLLPTEALEEFDRRKAKFFKSLAELDPKRIIAMFANNIPGAGIVQGLTNLLPENIRNQFSNLVPDIPNPIAATLDRFGLEIGTQAEKTERDVIQATQELINSSNETIAKMYEQIGDGTGSGMLRQVVEIDKELEFLQSQKRALPVTDTEGRKEIQSRIDDVIKTRQGLIYKLGALQNEAQTDIDSIQGNIKFLDELYASGGIREDEYKRVSGDLKKQLEAANKAAEQFGKIMRGNIDALSLIVREIKKINSEFANINAGIDMQASADKAGISLEQANGQLSEFQAGQSRLVLDQDILNAKIRANQEQIRKLQAQLAEPELSTAITTFGLQGAGSQEIRDKADSNDVKDSKDQTRLNTVADAIDKINELQGQINDYSGQIAEARVQAQSSLRDTTRSLRDFYQSVVDSNNELLNTIKTTQLDSQIQQLKNKIQSKLSGAVTKYFGGLADTIMEVIDLLYEPLKNQLQADSQIQQYRQQLRQQQQEGSDLVTGLQGQNAPGINPDGVSSSVASGNGATGGSGGGANGTVGGAFRSGLFTGESHTIGGSSEFHIDTKFSRDLSLDEMVKLFDQLSAAYREQGRQIEFSNAAVAGMVYDERKSLSERRALLDRALNAHHSQDRDRRNGVRSVDYYIPRVGENRFGSSVEHVEILLPNIPGARVDYQSGGGYGNFATMTRNGQLVMMTGHGDNTRALPSDRTLSASQPVQQSRPQQNQNQTARPTQNRPQQQQVSRPAGNLGARPVQLSSEEAIRLATLSILEAPTPMGRVDVAQAVMNRVNSGNYGRNVTEVAFAPGQFEPFFTRSPGQIRNEDDAVRVLKEDRGMSEQAARQALQEFFRMAADPNIMANAASHVGGRTDFKGTTMYQHRVASEDPLRTHGENFFHIGDNQSYSQLQRYRQMSPTAIVTPFANSAGTAASIGNSVANGSRPAGNYARTNSNVNMSGAINSSVTQPLSELGQTVDSAVSATLSNMQTLNEAAAIKARQTIEASIRQNELDSRELSEAARQSERNREDLEIQGMPDTPARARRIEDITLRREQEDAVRSQELEIKDAKASVERAQILLNSLKELVTQFPQFQPLIDSLTSTITTANQDIATLEKNLAATNAAFDGKRAEIEAQRAREEENRRFDVRSRTEGLENSLAQAQIEQLNRTGNGRTSLDVSNLIQRRETELNFDSQLRELTEMNRLGQLTNEEFAKMKELLEELRDTSLGNLTNQLEEARKAFDFNQYSTLAESRITLGGAIAESYSAMGFEVQSRNVQKQVAIAQQELDYQSQSRQIDEMAASGQYTNETITELRTNLESLNQVRLESIGEQFSLLGEMVPSLQGSFRGLFSDLLSGTKSAGEAFKDFAMSILNMLADMAAKFLTNELFGALMGKGNGNIFGSLLGGLQTSSSAASGGGFLGAGSFLGGNNFSSGGGGGFGSIIGTAFSLFSGGLGGGGAFGTVASSALDGLIGGFSEGGKVDTVNGLEEIRKSDSPIGRALRKEGSDSILAALTPGERVLTVAENKIYEQKRLDKLLTGEVQNFKEGGRVGGNVAMPSFGGVSKGGDISIPVAVNVSGENSDVNPDAVKRSIQDEVSRWAIREQRPGGLLNRKR